MIKDLERAAAVRLKGNHGKFLWASDDCITVSQSRDISDKATVWKLEHVSGSNAIRLRSFYGFYLTASDFAFLLGMTGKKVLQSYASKADSAVEWEMLVSEGRALTKLMTRTGTYLRANGGLPPWRNSVTHDVPVTAATQEWVHWKVEIVEFIPSEPAVEEPPLQLPTAFKEKEHIFPRNVISPSHSQSSSDDKEPMSPARTPRRSNIRRIFFTVADDKGEPMALSDDEWGSFLFEGHSLKHLTEQLQDETGIEEEIYVCARHPLSAKLFTLKLELPPNNAPMHVVVVRASSSVGQSILRPPVVRQRLYPDIARY